MRKKFHGNLRIKGEGSGQVEAVFALLNEEDYHGDVTLPGAFTWKKQEVVLEPWNHSYSVPVGRGEITEKGKEAIFRGRFFLDTAGGRDHFNALKQLGPLTQWSYSYDIVSARRGEFKGKSVQFLERLDVSGIGPVTRGAQPLTYTRSIKERGGPLGGDLRSQLILEELDFLEKELDYLGGGRDLRTRLIFAEMDFLENEMFNLQIDLAGQTIKRIERTLKARTRKSRAASMREQLLDEGYSLALAEVTVQAEFEGLVQVTRQSRPYLTEAEARQAAAGYFLA